MNKDIFSDSEKLNSDTCNCNINNDDAVKKLLYDKSYTCPVCGTEFKEKTPKISAYRSQKTDSDFYKTYAVLNPYFYDVVLCPNCGYAAIHNTFSKLRQAQVKALIDKIKLKWHKRTYPEIYDVNIAIERYKLSLLSYIVIDAKSSIKAINCLKLSWMYRLSNDADNELNFQKQALKEFNDAYFNEDFPLCGMDKYTSIYLIGELNRRTGSNEEALKCFSKVITTPNVKPVIKEMARDQRELIKGL